MAEFPSDIADVVRELVSRMHRVVDSSKKAAQALETNTNEINRIVRQLSNAREVAKLQYAIDAARANLRQIELDAKDMESLGRELLYLKETVPDLRVSRLGSPFLR
jgi:DNA anti-recombination protein RmuC